MVRIKVYSTSRILKTSARRPSALMAMNFASGVIIWQPLSKASPMTTTLPCQAKECEFYIIHLALELYHKLFHNKLT